MRRLLLVALSLTAVRGGHAMTVKPSAWTCSIGESISIVVSSDGSPYYGIIELTDETSAAMVGSDSGPDVRGSLGTLADPIEVGFPGAWFFVAVGPPECPPVPCADHFVFTYSALDDHSLVRINVYEMVGANDIEWNFFIQNTPEPMTSVLLGVGALFVRRR